MKARFVTYHNPHLPFPKLSLEAGDTTIGNIYTGMVNGRKRYNLIIYTDGGSKQCPIFKGTENQAKAKLLHEAIRLWRGKAEEVKRQLDGLVTLACARGVRSEA